MFQKIRELSKNLAIYGLGDVAVSIVNFLLLPLYVLYLTPEDYGALRLLGSVEVIAKIFFRWGLDGSFMRFYYDYEDTASRQRLASTILFFLAAVNGALLIIALLVAPVLAVRLFEGAPHLRALQLTLLNTCIIGFTFFPFHLLRMEKRAAQFSALTLVRSVLTVVLRIVLIVGFGLGVLGVVLADLAVTAALMAVLVRWFKPIIRPMFSRTMLRESLAFGLPRIPHAAAQQVIAVGDTFILKMFRPLHEIGVYSMGVSFGLTQKLFLSAFEYAWAPFYYANAREPDAKRLFSSMTTYGLAVLALMTAGLSAIGGDLLAAVTRDQAVYYLPAADVITWTAVGVFFQGAYLLTSIGLNITKNTQVLPRLDHGRGSREYRAELRAGAAIWHDGRGLGERNRVRDPGAARVSILAALLPGRVRNETHRHTHGGSAGGVPDCTSASRHAADRGRPRSRRDGGRGVYRHPCCGRVLQGG